MNPRTIIGGIALLTALLSIRVPDTTSPTGLLPVLADAIERDGQLPPTRQRIQHSNDVFDVLDAAFVFADTKPDGELSARVKAVVQPGPEPEKLTPTRRSALVDLFRGQR